MDPRRRARRARGSDAWDGYAATAVVDAALQSLDRGGQEVAVSLIERPALYER